MFWRLFLAFVAFAIVAAGLVGAFLGHIDADGLPTGEVVLGVVLVGLAAVLPAYALARRFVRPLHDLTEAARRIAEGNYGQRIFAGGPGESRSLARTFNAVSERLAAQFAQIEGERQQLRTILEGMVEGVIAVDAERRVRFANEAAAVMLAFDPQAAVGRKLWEITRQPQIHEIVEQALRGADARRAEFDRAGPGEKSLAVYVARLPGFPAPGAVLVLHDTTELRRLERLRQEFVANVSHELKTPLSVINSNVEALIDGAADDPHMRGPFLEMIAEQAARLQALILDLLSLARIESGAEALDFQPVPLGRAVAECLERHRTRAEAKNIRLDTGPSPDGEAGPTAWADEEALGQILDNLIDNAIKYTPAGGRVRVGWAENGKQVSFEVEDTGIGIPERDLPRIFERFYRVDRARSRELGGTGLGLAIVKHLTQVMKGTVRASSAVGKGTKFTVCLPRG